MLTRVGDGAAAELTPDDLPLEEGAVRLDETLAVDLFTLMSGQTYTDLLPETVRFLSAAGQIRLKSASLRPKDRLDAEALRAILRGERF